jgi:hypothetical protein
VKSQLQKAIRRNQPELAKLAAYELYLFSELPENKGKGIVTNLFNRIYVTSAEDIGPANVGLMIQVLKLKKNEPKKMLGAVEMMAKSKKTRVMSHVYRTLITPEGRNLAYEKYDQTIDDDMTPEDRESIGKNGIVWDEKDPKAIRIPLEMIKRRLDVGSLAAVIWLGYFMKAAEGKKMVSRKIIDNRRSTNPMMLVWLILKDFMEAEVWSTLVTAYLDISENRPFLMTAFMIVLFDVEMKPVKIVPVKELPKLKDLEIQPEAIDKHTKAGRASGKTRADFVSVGTVLIPEDMSFNIPQYRQVYED